MAVNTKVVVEVEVEMTLTSSQAKQLVFFLKTAVTAPRVDDPTEPKTNIVADLANSIESTLIRQGIVK